MEERTPGQRSSIFSNALRRGLIQAKASISISEKYRILGVLHTSNYFDATKRTWVAVKRRIQHDMVLFQAIYEESRLNMAAHYLWTFVPY
jgi:hypothetical protein